MNYKNNTILCFTQGIFFVLIILFASYKVRNNAYFAGHKIMCEEMSQDLYEDPGLDFYRNCVDQFSSFSSFKSWEANMNSWLGGYGLSHFAVYRPSDTKELWDSTSEETGAKFKNIEGKWVALKVHPDSPFKRGDLVLAINEKTKFRYKDLHKKNGRFKVKRENETLKLDVEVKEYSWNDEIFFKAPNIIEVPSFRKEFFDDNKNFLNILEKANSSANKEIIIDLRNNYGGNMGAGLSFLSYFFCTPVVIGYIERPRSLKEEALFPQTLDDQSQMDMLTEYKKLTLKTFKKDFCTDKKLKVVIDSTTSSTAELVAQAFSDLKRARLVGQPTSGQLVLARWNDIANFPQGYSYSYPVAIYKTVFDVLIEGYGVYPDVIKKRDLVYESKGIDSFLIN